MAEKEQKPLCIEYIIDSDGVHFGWKIDRAKISHYMPIWDDRQLDLIKKMQEDGTIQEKIKERILNFFNGPLSEDLKIPKAYPYLLYEYGKDEPYCEGKLREDFEEDF